MLALLDAARSQVLWCMHVLGIDEVHAAASYDDAQRMVDDMTAALADRGLLGGDVMLLPIVAPWPHSAESHASAVQRAGGGDAA